ncbi:hypothetical protein [Mesorhizobium sp. M0676]|uniref:hypothetical protein n=1 Tax=Mesorhizobium sp. M0676 TaxID=2956984 RepID=UPI00333C06B4
MVETLQKRSESGPDIKETSMIAATSLARYSAVEGALASGFATAELHYRPGTTVRVAAEGLQHLNMLLYGRSAVTHEAPPAQACDLLVGPFAGDERISQLPDAVVSPPAPKL